MSVNHVGSHSLAIAEPAPIIIKIHLFRDWEKANPPDTCGGRRSVYEGLLALVYKGSGIEPRSSYHPHKHPSWKCCAPWWPGILTAGNQRSRLKGCVVSLLSRLPSSLFTLMWGFAEPGLSQIPGFPASDRYAPHPFYVDQVLWQLRGTPSLLSGLTLPHSTLCQPEKFERQNPGWVQPCWSTVDG